MILELKEERWFSADQGPGELVIQQRVLGQQQEFSVLNILPWNEHISIANFSFNPMDWLTHIEPVCGLMVGAVQLIRPHGRESRHLMIRNIYVSILLRVPQIARNVIN